MNVRSKRGDFSVHLNVSLSGCTQAEHNACGKQESCARQEVFFRIVSSEFILTFMRAWVHPCVCVCVLMTNSALVCVNVLVATRYARMLLTPLTLNETEQNVKNQGHKQGPGSGVGQERFLQMTQWVQLLGGGCIDGNTERKAEQEAKHS